MRDFDAARAERAERNQTFTIGGEVFRVIPGVHPSVFSDYEDSVMGATDLLGAMDALIKAFLWDKETRDRWDTLRARKEDPITHGDLRALIAYLYEVESDLPTSAPEPSSGGRVRTKKQSGAASSSPAEVAS